MLHTVNDDTGTQVPPNQFQHPFILHALREQTHQHVVVNAVEERRQININHDAVSGSDVFTHAPNGLMRATSGTETVTVIAEQRLVDRGEYLREILPHEVLWAWLVG